MARLFRTVNLRAWSFRQVSDFKIHLSLDHTFLSNVLNFKQHYVADYIWELV